MGGHIPTSINLYLLFCQLTLEGFPGGAVLKNPPTNSGNADVGSIPGSGRSLEEEIATHSSSLA